MDMVIFLYIAVFIIIIAVAVLLVLVLIRYFRRGKKKRQENDDLNLYRDLYSSPSEEQIKKIESQIAEISSSLSKQNLENTQVMSTFQKNITESVNHALSNSQETIDKKINEIQNNLDNKLNSNNKGMSETQMTITKTVNEALNKSQEKIDQKMNEMQKNLDAKLSTNTKDMSETFITVSKELQKIADTSKNLETLQSDVISLRDIFRHPQTRGQFGEHQLTGILETMFGNNDRLYKLQYEMTLNDGSKIRPDAVLFLPHDLLLCIDSKFPLESYSKYLEAKEESEKKECEQAFYNAIKGHIETVSEKYIINGITYPQALLFVPSDGIYTFMVQTYPHLWDEAYQMNVTLVSPSIIGPILAGIMMLKREEMMNEDAKRINQELIALSQGFKEFSTAWSGVSKRISGLNKAKGTLNTAVKKVDQEFTLIKSHSGDLIENKETLDNDDLSLALKEIAIEEEDDDE